MAVAAARSSKVHSRDRPSLEQRVLDLALERLQDCLENPSDRALNVCGQLGIQHHDLAAAVVESQRQRQNKRGKQGRLCGVGNDSSAVQV